MAPASGLSSAPRLSHWKSQPNVIEQLDTKTASPVLVGIPDLMIWSKSRSCLLCSDLPIKAHVDVLRCSGFIFQACKAMGGRRGAVVETLLFLLPNVVGDYCVCRWPCLLFRSYHLRLVSLYTFYRVGTSVCSKVLHNTVFCKCISSTLVLCYHWGTL